MTPARAATASTRTAHDQRSRRRLRLCTYNVLLGGLGREELIADVLADCDADVIALQEASDPGLLALLGERLQMSAVVGQPSEPESTLHLALLSRLPLRGHHNHQHQGMLRSHLAVEVGTGSRLLPLIRVHVVHLAARFGERNNGEVRRMREIADVLDDIELWPPAPHVVVGDFNAVAPGDHVAATAFFARMAELRAAGLVLRGEDGFEAPLPRPEHADALHDERWRAVGINPRLDIGIPRLPWIVGPVTARLPISGIVDRVLNTRIRRDTVDHLLRLGYVDCYRSLHDDAGQTCATWMPAARIDYIFADPTLASRLHSSAVVGGSNPPESEVADASDHFPLLAEFRW